jgi:hypothetical protein
MSTYLPPRYWRVYSPLFSKQFLICVLTVAWKLGAVETYRLSCVGEELALHAIIDAAKLMLDINGGTADFDGFENAAFLDIDFEILFDSKLDGFEETPAADVLRVANLRFEDCFSPFRDDDPVHPYLEPDDLEAEDNDQASGAK